MNNKLSWKWLLIVLLVAIAGWNVYPPQDKLKPGIDIGGGTSLIYDIDASDLPKEERRGLAERMIPILLKRVDPTSVANILMRPQGDTRIEIQLPMASQDTIDKRDAYTKALDALGQKNINLLTVKHSLSLDSAERDKALEKYAAEDETRSGILKELASAYDALKAKQSERDLLDEKKTDLKAKLDEAKLDGDMVATLAPVWSKKSDKAIADAVAEHVNNRRGPVDPNAPVDAEAINADETLVADYVSVHKDWAAVVNELAEPETGLNDQWTQAAAKLAD